MFLSMWVWGCDTPTFQGLDAYVALMRCVAFGPWDAVLGTWVSWRLEAAASCVCLFACTNGCSVPAVSCRRCWAQRPEDRPGFEEVIHEIRAMLKAHSEADAEAKAAGSGGIPSLSSESSIMLPAT